MLETRTVLTYSDYRNLPEDDHSKYEMLWGGVLFVAGAPSFRHQRVQARLIEKMLRHVDERSLGGIVGRINLYRDKYNYVQPDISYFTEAQVSILDGEQAVHLVPLLVVELLSPSTAHHDRLHQRHIMTATISVAGMLNWGCKSIGW